jgi:thymidylate kinase
MAKIPATEIDNKDKVYNLYKELAEAKNDKKETVKAHNENIKRIQDELDDILDEEEEAVKATQKSVDE